MNGLHKKEILIEELTAWFLENKRKFPWREEPTPYQVWVSEVMLQQTRADVVIDYFRRWMARFPTVEALAKSEESDVIKTWEGLGYYSRARNLHQGAKLLVQEYGGVLPSSAEELSRVKGLGPYTVGAVLSFAFGKKAPAVDGNVLRVISRLLCIEESVDLSTTQKKIRQLVEELLPDKNPQIAMEGFIELGALVCQKKPKCESCPLQNHCQAFLRGKAETLPIKKPKEPSVKLYRDVPLITYGEMVLIQKHSGKKVMSGLCEFPYFERPFNIKNFYPAKVEFYKKLVPVVHTFTRYRAQLFPEIWVAKIKQEIKGYQWVERKELSTLPFSSGHKKIVGQLQEEYAFFTHRKF